MDLRLSPTWTRGEDTLRRALAQARRVAPGPALIRLTVLLFGAVGLVVALPTPLRGSFWAYPVIAVFAVAPALRPDSPWVTAVEVVTVGSWLLTTMLYHQPADLVGTVALTALLYGHHSTSALAAALPVSAQLAPGVLMRWLLRTGVVLVAAAVLMTLLVLLLPATGTARSVSALPLLGLFAAVGAGVLLAYLLHRRR